MTRRYAVLTGDLVGSTKAGPARTGDAMSVLSDTLRAAPWSGLTGPFTRFRGDGWQVLLAAPEMAVRVALVLCAALRASDTGLESRMAIGLGAISGSGSRDLSDADGPSFRRAGQALDAMKRNRRLDLAPETAPPAWRAAVPLLDAISQGWTPAQATAALPLLHPDPPAQKVVADTLGIRAQSLSDRLSAARLDHVRVALDILEALPLEQDSLPDTPESGHE